MHRKLYSSPTQVDYAARAKAYKVEVISQDDRKRRLFLLGVLALVWSVLIVCRLYSLQLADFSKWQESALKQHFSKVELAPERGPIYDRSGKLLAVSVPAGSVWVRPKKVKDKQFVSEEVSKILELDSDFVLDKLEQDRPFVWIKRQVPKVHAKKIEALDVTGLGYYMEPRRFYPYKSAASTLIGKVGIDGKGLSGLEAVFDKQLSGSDHSATVTLDALGNRIEIASKERQDFELPRGASLKLTLDADIQAIVDEELKAGQEKANALQAMALMVDADSGEILAMSQAPGVNFNADKIESRDALKNLVVETIFEPGSILKPIVAASAIEAGIINPNDVIDCEDGKFRFGRHMINDVHPNGDLSFYQVVVQSSNIGMTKVGTMLGKDRLFEGLEAFGFGSMSRLKLPGESGGILRAPSKWAAVDVATHSFGQGIAVNPMQVLRAVSAIANGGILPELKIVMDEGVNQISGKRVISEETAAVVKKMMYGVVEEEDGTGKLAAIEGVRVGGKTGTAQRVKEDGRGYEDKAYTASFVGFADASELGIKRRLSLIVVVDKPNTTSIYGGTLAGPVFKRIMQKTLYLLGTRNKVNPRFEPMRPLDTKPSDMHFRRVSFH